MFSIFVPLEAVLEARTGNVVFRAKGGGFAFYNFNNHVNYGNFDRALAEFYGWETANAKLDYDNNIGFGYMAGAEVILYLTQQFGINIEVNYLSGGSEVNLRGNVTGADAAGIETVNLEYPGSRIDFTGWEITFGIILTNNR
jgi:hypothetical protein